MSREQTIYLDDIISSCERIEEYKQNLSYKRFIQDYLRQDAIIRNLTIIGEAVKNISNELKLKNPEIEWKLIAGVRDVLVHNYAGIQLPIIWDIVTNELPSFKSKIIEIRKEL